MMNMRINTIPIEEYRIRIQKTREAMQQMGFEILLAYSNASAVAHVMYLSGYRALIGNAVMALPLDKEPALFIDLEWDLDRTRETSLVNDARYAASLIKGIRKFLDDQDLSRKTCAFIGKEAMPATLYEELQKWFPRTQLRFTTDLLMKIRREKSPWEIRMLNKAATIVDSGMSASMDGLEPGKSELQVSLEAELAMKATGGEKTGALVSSGINTDVPARFASTKRIRQGDLVLIDLQSSYHGYWADITRTVIVGKPSKKQEDVFELVLEARDNAMKAVAPGVQTIFIDRIARETIEKKGYGQYFPHRVGHGLGLDLEEFDLGRDLFQLTKGNVFTIEPGVHIKNFGGVRIEDDVVVTKTGSRSLARSRRSWQF